MTLEEAKKKYQEILTLIDEGEDFDNSELFDIINALFKILNINPNLK